MQKYSIVFLFLLTTCIIGCSENYDIIPSEEPVLLSSNNSNSIVGSSIELKTTQGGEDVTDNSTFYIDGEELEGHIFASQEVGDFIVSAKYNNILTDSIIITFHDGSNINFKKRVLIEDYTGTWCGYCARVAYAVEQVRQNTENIVLVGIHRNSSEPTSATYDPYNFDTSIIEENLSAVGYPKGYLNRNILWENPEPQNINQVLELSQGENPKLGLAISNEVNNNNVNLTVNVKIAKDFDNLKLVVYVLENGLIYEQKNYTQFFEAENPIHDFEHNHVLRESLTNLLGDEINMNEFQLNIYSKTYNFTIPDNIENPSNMEFVAFIVNEDGTSINARKSGLNVNQDFEEI